MFKGKERVIEIPGFKIAAKEWGNPDGPKVLAIHGWLDSAASYDFLAPLLPNLHIIAVDSPGCGHSSHKETGSIPMVIEEPFYMFQVANALGWDKFSIIGHSRGGVIAELMAAGYPERIQLLVLLDIAGLYLVGTPEEAVQWWNTCLHDYLLKEMKPAQVFPDLESMSRDRMNGFMPVGYESAVAIVKRGSKKVEGGYVWAFDRKELYFRSPIKYTYEGVKAMLNAIQAPTCFILAEKGYIKIDHKAADFYPECIPNHVVHYVPGGHHAHMDNAAVVAPIILDFFKANLK